MTRSGSEMGKSFAGGNFFEKKFSPRAPLQKTLVADAAAPARGAHQPDAARPAPLQKTLVADAGGPIITRLIPPDQRPCIAQAYWTAAGPKARRYLLWDIRQDSRHELFISIARDGQLFAGYLNGCLAGLAWFLPVSPLARCAAPHFSMNIHDRNLAIALGSQILFQARPFYDSLLALIPKPLTGARRVARALGFTPGAMLSGACNLNGRIVAGEVLSLNFKRQCRKG